MDLGSVDVDEKASPHSADDRHQHYAVSKVVDDRPAPRRVEVLLGKERRRRWSADEKAEITAASFVPGANISAVARQYGVSQGLLHYWRRCAREHMSDDEEMRFVPVVRADEGLGVPAAVTALTIRVEINGTCAVIEGGIDEQALCMVFKALRASA
ncbi:MULTISPECIES: IS66-like element accessory protein TnpA [Brucella]|nr:MULTISPECIES: transposase [Brucella]EPZ76230.1 transposase IS66 [Brucella melitensis ADMAS-G1]ERU01235.1 hypothetical protein P039_02661 [Brucella abortus 07-0994-2411]EXU81995.1 transposase IS66 [Brucella melitensis 548]KEX96755.1 transposase [Brucella inopinata BO1]AAN33748.1 IS66 family element, orf1, transposase, putative [Brucella suis 1330]